MALTQVESGGIKDGTIVAADIANDTIGWEKINENAITDNELAPNAVVTTNILDDAVTADKLANSINTEIAANTAKVTNATHTGEVTGATALTIADDAVTLAKMAGLARGKIIVGDASGNPSALAAGSDNHVLTMDANGDVGWEAAAGGGVDGISSSADATAITIDSSERVMIGGSSIDAHASADNLQIGTASGTNGLCILSGTGDNGEIHFGDGGSSGNANIQGQIVYRHSNSSMGLMTAATERLHLDSSGNAEIKDGNLKVADGHGVDFSATGDGTGSSSVSELFDDYEEGTWSPSCIQGTVTATRAKYTKIGNMVFLEGYFTSFSDYTTDSMFGWDNLPFTPAGVAGAYGNIIFTECDGIDLAAGEMNCIVNSDPSIMVYGGTSAGSWKYVKHADLNSGAAMYMSCAYRVS